MLKNIRIVAFLSFIEGLASVIWLASIPTSGGTFSPFRLTLMLGILIISLACLAIFIYINRETGFSKKIQDATSGSTGLFLSLLLLGISLATWVLILYKRYWVSIVNEAIYVRLFPVAFYSGLLSLQFGMVLLIHRIKKVSWEDFFGSIWKPSLILLGSFLILWGFMSKTHLGFVFDTVGLSWGPPGTPISFPQIVLVFAISMGLAFTYMIFRSRLHLQQPLMLDIIIFIGLWGLAVILWWREPVDITHFNPPIMAPNYETYPNSDALIFDKSAYHLLYGVGFRDQLIRRPLYVGMLALFHKLGGFGYERTIFLQILVLAFIPALIYLLTSKLSNRLAGLIAGGLILIREKNAIELSGKIVTSNAKLMMSDMAAMLGVIAFVYVMVKLLSEKDRNIWLLLSAGACLGLTALVRAQVLILLPLAFLFLLIEKRPLKLKIRESIFITAGVILVMLPWVWRNWNLTGTFVLDDRGEEKLLARNYSSHPVGFPPYLPGETDKEYSARIRRDVITYVIEHPLDVAFFVSNHFLRNMAVSVINVPPLYSADPPAALIERTPYWYEWRGSLTLAGGISLLLTLALLAFGIGVAQDKNKFAGWFPLAVFITYNIGNALVRSSGWRFSLPVDWVILIYFSIALAYLPSKIKLDIGEDAMSRSDPVVSTYARRSMTGLIVFAILVLIGASMPIVERLIPDGDSSVLMDQTHAIKAFESVIPSSEIDNFLEQDDSVLLSGLALYPRYITPNSRIYLAYTPPREFKFLHFWLINEGDNQIVFPIGIPPEFFPHTARVSILGCQKDNYIMAWAVVLHSSPEQVFVTDEAGLSGCPLNVQK